MTKTNYYSKKIDIKNTSRNLSVKITFIYCGFVKKDIFFDI